MTDWLLSLPVAWMGIVVFAATYLAAAAVYFVVTTLAVGDRAKAFKALSPGMLPPLGIIFGLMVGFLAAQVWSDFERAKVSVATEATALRGVMLLAEALPPEQQSHFRSLVEEHIEAAVKEEWPRMALGKATLTGLPSSLREALRSALAYVPADESQRC